MGWHTPRMLDISLWQRVRTATLWRNIMSTTCISELALKFSFLYYHCLVQCQHYCIYCTVRSVSNRVFCLCPRTTHWNADSWSRGAGGEFMSGLQSGILTSAANYITRNFSHITQIELRAYELKKPPSCNSKWEITGISDQLQYLLLGAKIF